MSRRPPRRDRVTALMLLLRADPCSGLPRRRFLRGGLFRGWLRQPLGLRPLRARRLRRTRSGADGMFEFFERFRSEEHTSELQSLMRISYAVFCLKKTTQQRLIK